MDVSDTEPVDWERFRNAFDAAAEALVSAIPPDLSPVHVALTTNRSMEITLTDSPMTRSAVAGRDSFASEAEANAGILRLWGFLALIPHLPSELLFEAVATDELGGGDGIREEAFIVASTIRLTRKGKLPRQKFINEVRAILDTKKRSPGYAMPRG